MDNRMADPIDPPGGAARVARVQPLRDARGRFFSASGQTPKARLAAQKRKEKAEDPATKAKPKRGKHWREQFLAALSETSNISAACTAAAVDRRDAYKARNSEPAFAAAWRAALLEGYEALELETLCRLREGELRSDDRKFDIANALRLLKAHAEAVAAERARREDRDEEDILESLDRKIEAMRQRAAANGATPTSADVDAD
jgi:hypothetical protein